MSDTPNDNPHSNTPPEAATGADAKRLAARRRFLARGTAAGSGFAIVTLYHQRAFAWRFGGRDKVLVSSPETCLSLGGKAKGTSSKVKDSVTGKSVKRFECDLP
jgi:hypothetical protein